MTLDAIRAGGTAQTKESEPNIKQWNASKRVTLEFANDEAAANAPLTTIEYPDVTLDRKLGRGTLFEFGPAQTFKQPVTLTVDVSGLMTPELFSAGYEPQLLYWPDTPDKDGITRATQYSLLHN